MRINRPQFYREFKLKFSIKKLTQEQVDSIECIFNEIERNDIQDIRWVSYMLATVYHETAATMLPIEEYGKGKGKLYGRRIKHSGLPYTNVLGIMYGRGYVMLTWYENYDLMGRLLGIDLLHYPEKASDPKIAAKILVEGMTKGSSSFGDFTGKCLEQYFNDKIEDPLHARRIINGMDKTGLIETYYNKFKLCLT